MTADRTRNERLKKEQKQAERDMQRLQKQWVSELMSTSM
jgi:hypothetical protein